MLDILSEESSKKVHRHLLGAFLDLLENPKARSHALEWKYVDAHEEEKKSLVNLLIKLWREEEKALGCKYFC